MGFVYRIRKGQIMVKKKKTLTAKQEIELLCKRHNNLLRPIDIVEYAKNKKTALHKCFEWDDTKAAHEYRLWQARELIRVYVKILPNNKKPIRAFVSLYPDRQKAGGGYRPIDRVLINTDQRQQLLAQALKEFKYWQEKYQDLKELSEIFEAARKVKNKVKKIA